MKEPKKRTMDKAPEGQVYVCGACGRAFNDPYEVDVSCMLNRVLCYDDSLKFGKDGRVVAAKPVEEEHEQEDVAEESHKNS